MSQVVVAPERCRLQKWALHVYTKNDINAKALEAMEMNGLTPRSKDLISRTGNHKLKGNPYKSHYKDLEQFCMLVGDYDSLIVLNAKCPMQCISMKIDTLQAYIKYRLLEKDAIIRVATGNCRLPCDTYF